MFVPKIEDKPRHGSTKWACHFLLHSAYTIFCFENYCK